MLYLHDQMEFGRNFQLEKLKNQQTFPYRGSKQGDYKFLKTKYRDSKQCDYKVTTGSKEKNIATLNKVTTR